MTSQTGYTNFLTDPADAAAACEDAFVAAGQGDDGWWFLLDPEEVDVTSQV